jgi:hypothetical protein
VQGRFEAESDAGSGPAERLLTVVITRRHQEQSLYDFPVTPARLALRGAAAPTPFPNRPGEMYTYRAASGLRKDRAREGL